MKKLLTVVATGAILTTAAVAGQVTIGDWDFIGVDCFPGVTAGWGFDAIAGDGVVIVDVVVWSWGQYDVIYEGGGMIHCILADCVQAGLGAEFDCNVPDDIFNHYLPEVIVEMPMTFCGFCDEPTEVIPTEFALANAYPNPFNPTTTIDYSISEPCHVTLTVFNVAGQEVATLVNGEMEVGNFDVTFDAADLASGVYFYKLNAGDFSAIKKMTLVK